MTYTIVKLGDYIFGSSLLEPISLGREKQKFNNNLIGVWLSLVGEDEKTIKYRFFDEVTKIRSVSS